MVLIPVCMILARSHFTSSRRIALWTLTGLQLSQVGTNVWVIYLLRAVFEYECVDLVTCGHEHSREA